MIFYPPEQSVALDDLLESQLLFVWDELLDPDRRAVLLGRHAPFAPAFLPGFARRIIRAEDGFAYELTENEDAVTGGFVLLGLTAGELEIFDQFEQVPMHRIRHTRLTVVGNLERVASVHLTEGAYLAE